MRWFRRRRRGVDVGALEGPLGLGDGEAPGGWDPEDGWTEPDPVGEPIDVEPTGPWSEVGPRGRGSGSGSGSGSEAGAAPWSEVGEAGPAAAAAGFGEAAAGGDGELRSAPRPPTVLRGAVLVAVLLVAGLVADHVIGTGSATRVVASSGPSVPEVPAADSLSSTWFCPALQATARSDAKGRLIIANPTGGLLTGTVTLTPSSGAPVVIKPQIQPWSRLTYKLEGSAPGPYAAATVSLDEPGGAVEQEVQGPLGQSIAPCATASASHWYFASGQTTDGNTELLSLYNPYPAPAIADLTFVTDIGQATPDAFQGIVVPAGGFNVIDVGARVRLRAAVSADVEVRSGRLVVDKVEIQNGTPHGLSLALGATAPGTTWYYPDGVSGPGLKERFDIYNPGAQEADVALTPALDQGSADAFPLTVPPFDRVSLEVDGQQRIPPGIGQAWVLTSTNGVPVVGERIIQAASPSGHIGVGDTVGTPRLATDWIFAAGSASAGSDEWLVLFDPGKAPAHVQLTASGLGQAQPLTPVTVPAGSRLLVHVGAEYPKGIVVVQLGSSVPIAAERAQFLTGAPGMSDTIGIIGSG